MDSALKNMRGGDIIVTSGHQKHGQDSGNGPKTATAYPKNPYKQNNKIHIPTTAPQQVYDIDFPGTGWGNLPSGIQEEDALRVIGHNINRLKVYTAPENQQLLQGLENLHLEKASAVLIQENNTDFKKLEVRCDWNNVVKTHWPAHHSSHTTSTTKLHIGRHLP